MKIQQAEADIANAPEGSLRLGSRKGKPRFFRRMKETESHGEMVYKSVQRNSALIQALSQKEYAESYVKTARRQQKALLCFLKDYQEAALVGVYDKMHAAKQQYITPYSISDREYAKQWLEQPFERKMPPEDGNGQITENGEVVRSKSEKIIADKFFYKRIPYKYEMRLDLKGINTPFYPDFRVLNVRKREEYIFEHFGMMDDPEYVQGFIRKLDVYLKNGIIPGKNLIMTFETRDTPLSSAVLEMLIQEFLL